MMALTFFTKEPAIELRLFLRHSKTSIVIFLIIILFAVILAALMHISFIADNISGAKIFTVGGFCSVKWNVWGHSISISNFSIVVLGPVLCISLICYTFDRV